MSVQQPPSTSQTRWIWPFEIIEQIGEGGMGVVYRARYVVNGRQVALKMLPSDVTDKTALARFERELEVLKTLRHANIVRCFGGVCEDKRRFYAMELLEGGSLEDQLRLKGRFAWEQVIYYGLQMCAALECSHQKGVVHRDIKPSNFLLTPTGQLKLSDFGLASVMASRKITAAGKTAGTFLYMAPEQIRGQEITPRTDLYALGCVLYELLTGQVPFIGDSPGTTLHLHCYSAPVRPSEKALDCPVQLERIILRLLEKDPADRPPSAGAVAKELRSVNQTVTVVGLPEEFDRRTSGQADRRKNVEALKKTTQLSMASRVPAPALFAVLMVLALSLIWNVSHLLRGDVQQDWRRLWLQAFESSSADVRKEAVRAFGAMAARDRMSLESLTAGISDPDEHVRLASVQELGNAGNAARSTIPLLIKLQNTDGSQPVRDAATAAVQRIRTSDAGTHFPWLGLCLISGLVIAAAVGLYWWFRFAEQAGALPQRSSSL